MNQRPCTLAAAAFCTLAVRELLAGLGVGDDAVPNAGIVRLNGRLRSDFRIASDGKDGWSFHYERDLRKDPERKAMLLRRTMGPKYVLSAYVDNVEAHCFSPEPAESRGSAP